MRMPERASHPALSLELPRLPCGDHTCGVLMCVHTSSRPARDRAIVREAVLSARVLRKFSQPLYPMALIATEDAHAMLSTSEAALWEVHRPLRLSGPILAAWMAARGLERRWSRQWERAARLSFVHKLQALLDTPFARTVFVDCDLYVLDGAPQSRIIARTLHVCMLHAHAHVHCRRARRPATHADLTAGRPRDAHRPVARPAVGRRAAATAVQRAHRLPQRRARHARAPRRGGG